MSIVLWVQTISDGKCPSSLSYPTFLERKKYWQVCPTWFVLRQKFFIVYIWASRKETSQTVKKLQLIMIFDFSMVLLTLAMTVLQFSIDLDLNLVAIITLNWFYLIFNGPPLISKVVPTKFKVLLLPLNNG